VLNPNDKNSSQFQTSQGTIFIGASNNTRFGDVSYNLIFSTGGSDNNGLAIGTLSNTEPLIFGVDNTEVIRIIDNGEQRVGIKTSNPSATLEVNGNAIINGNLSMSDQFINDVSGIYFSDGTYIGHGSSFDITTSETLDISAAGGISVTGNLTIYNATTVNKTLDVVGNTTLENLIINGSINNLIEISGNTIQPIISEYVNLGYDESGSSNDKRFNLGFFNKINTRTAVIVGNLSMSEQYINDVSGIYFSDGTYIGHGSSFDITTSETLDISAAGGINLNTDVTINSNITINSNLTANTINTQRLLFPSGNYIDYDDGVGQLYVNGNTTLAHQVQLLSTLDVSGATTIRSNLSMNDNFINDVSGIYFSDATYISHGSSFDITTSETLDITAAGGVTITGNLTIDAATTIDNTLDVSGATTIRSNLSMSDQFINDVSGIYFSDGTYIGHGSSFDITTSETLDISAAGGISVTGNLTIYNATTIDASTIIKANLSMDNNFINDVSGIYFTHGNLLFSDFSSINQSVQLPSSQGQPISLERKTLFYDSNFNTNTAGAPVDISFVVPAFNQLGLTISGSGNTIISPSLDISGQYVEIYANFLVNSANSNSKTIALDISGVSQGSTFIETIDVRTITKQGSYYITFGPHIFAPEQWVDTSEFVITANTTSTFIIEQYKLMLKSYFM